MCAFSSSSTRRSSVARSSGAGSPARAGGGDCSRKCSEAAPTTMADSIAANRPEVTRCVTAIAICQAARAPLSSQHRVRIESRRSPGWQHTGRRCHDAHPFAALAAAPWPRRREGSFRTVLPERFYPEVPEVRDGSSIDPQRHTSSSLRTRLQVIDDQCRLFLVVDVETRAFPTHVDLDLGPDGRQQADVRFILLRAFRSVHLTPGLALVSASQGMPTKPRAPPSPGGGVPAISASIIPLANSRPSMAASCGNRACSSPRIFSRRRRASSECLIRTPFLPCSTAGSATTLCSRRPVVESNGYRFAWPAGDAARTSTAIVTREGSRDGRLNNPC